MSEDSLESTGAWTAYWRTGRGASCFEGSDAEVQLNQLWDELVDQLENGARVLDLATGNGMVVRSCAARARLRNIRLAIEAVDAAEIDPPSHVSHPGQVFGDARFHGGISLEALPFPDATFDAVVSQFGFEYAKEVQSAAEAARVLAPGGRLRLLVHAREGAVARDIARRLERLRSALAENGPVTLVLALVRAVEAGDLATLSRMSADLGTAAELTRRLAERPPPDDAALFYSREFLQLWARRGRYRLSDLRRSLEDGWRNATGVAMRQEQMLHVACSAEDVARICQRFAALGLLLEPARQVRDRRGGQIAWLIDATRPLL